MMAACRKREVTSVRHAGTFLPSLFANDNNQTSNTKDHPSTITNIISNTVTTTHKPTHSYQSIIMPPAFTECHIHLGHDPSQIDDEKASHHLQEPQASHNSHTHDPNLLEVTHDRVSSSSALLYSSPQPTLDTSPSSSSSSTHAIMGMDALTSQEVASGLLQTENDLDVGNISDRDYSDGKVCVPDTLGAETVVETSSLDGKFLNASLSTKRVSQAVLASKGNIDTNYLMLEEDGKAGGKVIQAEDLVEIFETQTLQAFLAQRDSAISSHSNSTDKNSLNCVGGESQMTKGMSIVYVGDEGMQLVPTDAIEEEEEEDCNLPAKDVMKRERDRMKKREQRANPMYREKEKEKAKARMRMMRADPNYRERERRRDRIRRKISRQQNNELRQKEKDRDKEYKRLHRNLPLNSVMTEVEIGTNDDSGMGTSTSIGTSIGSGGTKTVLELHPQHFALRHSVLASDVAQLGGMDDGGKMVGHVSEAGGMAPTDLNCMTLSDTRAEVVLTCPVTLQYTLTTDGHRIMT